MKRRWSALSCAAAIAAAVAILVLASASPAEAGKRRNWTWTDTFSQGACSSLATSTATGASNPYFILEVGRVWELSNQPCVDDGKCDELEEVQISVLPDTEMVDGTLTRVVEEREWVDGELAEVSRNFYVECVGTGDVYYYGEDVEDGDGNPLPDGWRSGVNGARYGLIFPGGTFLLNGRYYQEVAPGVALDRAMNSEMNLDVDVPAGSFSDCVLVLDFNGLEDPRNRHPDEKIYCPGIGFTTDEELVLTSYVDP